MNEENYIARVKAANPHQFADKNALLKMRAFHLEDAIRKAYRAGVEDAENEKPLFKKIFG